MAFEIREIGTDTVEVVLTSGLDRAAASAIQASCMKRCEQGFRHLLFNMVHLTYLDSAGIGLLIGLRTHAKAKGGGLRLINVHPELLHIFKTMKLEKVFELT